jgi:hypothetical protein
MKNKEHKYTEGGRYKITSPGDYINFSKGTQRIITLETVLASAFFTCLTDNGTESFHTLKDNNHLEGNSWIVESKIISKEGLLDIIEAQKKRGVYFTVWFIKKDGTERKMTCRFGVKKHLHGGKSTLDESKFFTVYSMADADYRAVSKETVFKVKVGGLVYEIE